MDIEQIVENINNGSTVKLESEKLNISDRTLQRQLKNAGYEFVRKEKKYIKTSGAASPDASPKKKQEDLIDAPQKDFNRALTTTQTAPQKIISRTYSIQEDILKALKLKSVLEEIDMSEIVNAALKSYIEEKYYNFKL